MKTSKAILKFLIFCILVAMGASTNGEFNGRRKKQKTASTKVASTPNCDCEFRFWRGGDTTYASEGWNQSTVDELETCKTEFITQYNADNGLQPIGNYTSNVVTCAISQDSHLSLVWRVQQQMACPTADGNNAEWSLTFGSYYHFFVLSTDGWNVYYPLNSTDTFHEGEIIPNPSCHSIFAKCDDETKSLAKKKQAKKGHETEKNNKGKNGRRGKYNKKK